MEKVNNNREKFLWWGQEPYPDDSPVLIRLDADLGWIVETVNDGEYEVQNLPFGSDNKNSYPDFDLAIKEAKERNVRIQYYHEWQ